MILEWICLAAFILYFVGFETAWGLKKYKMLIQAIRDGRMPRTKLYLRMMAGLWAPLAAVAVLLAAGRVNAADIGLRRFAPTEHTGLLIAAGIVAGL